jgi:hypothetical protein
MIICKICKKSCLNRQSYANHIRWNHNSKVYKKNICIYCSNEFAKCGIKKHEVSCDLNPIKKRNCKCCGEIVAGYRKMFCDRSCAATFNNTHKTHGTRRSKIEFFFEKELVKLYPGLEFVFNKKTAINSELDIYIPSLRVAFEINGIYHYRGIHGTELLKKIQNNDLLKQKTCRERKINLYTVDVSSMSTFNEKAAVLFLDKIKKIIDNNKELTQ